MIVIQLLFISIFAQARIDWNEGRSRSWVKAVGLELTENLEVLSVKSGSYAQVIAPECGGIRIDDKIITVNGKPVKNLFDFEKMMRKSARKHTQQWSFLIERVIPTSSKKQFKKEPNKEKRFFVAEVSREYMKSCDPIRLRGCGPAPGGRNFSAATRVCEYRRSPHLKDRI